MTRVALRIFLPGCQVSGLKIQKNPGKFRGVDENIRFFVFVSGVFPRVGGERCFLNRWILKG